MYILSLNSGSSSIKFQLFSKKDFKLLGKGEFEAIGLKNSRLQINTYSPKKELHFKASAADHNHAIKQIFQQLLKNKIISSLDQVSAIGHRFVHGGTEFVQPLKITPQNLLKLKKLLPLAPLHNPPNFAGIVACQKLMPRTPQVAVFDTAFHHTLPAKSYTYPLPENLLKKFPLRKFGFHGTNHSYISRQAIDYLKQSRKKHQRIVTCHLGNGISLTAVKNGKSVDTTMGYTPLEGPVMGTRSGTIDPAVPLLLCQKLKKTPEEVLTILNKQSGLLALSGISSDFRPIRHAAVKKNQRALLTVEILGYQIAKYIGSYAAALNGLEAIVFSGGIGEHAHHLRTDICNYLSFLGVKLNQTANSENQPVISSPGSKVVVLIVPANEEKAIARQTLALL